MVSFDEACLFSALEGETKFWITLYLHFDYISSFQGLECISGDFK